MLKHKNTLFINNYQKSLLDAGIALNVIYGEEKIACFTATLTDEYDSHTGSRRPEIYYTVEGLDGFERYMASFETEGGMYGIDQELLDSDRYYGLAFYFREPYSWMQYLPVLEENYKVSVSGAVMIDTLDGSIRGETMTIDQFYEENRDMYKIRVCVENGEVVKLEEWYVP